MDVLFSAELNDLKIVHNVLKAINFKEYATIRIMKEGLKVTVEEMKSVQTSTYIPSNVFTRYQINTEDEEPATFKISLKVLTECLNIFGDDGAPSLKIIYKDFGSPLSLVLIHSEENITADCDIKTMEADDLAELSLADECTLNNIVVNSNQFVNLLAELDSSADVFELFTSPDAPFFKICTIGILGECHIEIPKTSDLVVIFRCTTVCTAQYIFSYIKQLIKVMGLSTKVSISTSEQGLLGLQLIINTESDKQMYVEYYVTALLQND